MSKKIVFVDFDGTLLADDKSLPDKNREALSRLLDEGVTVAFNTGRSVNSGMMLLDGFKIAHPNIYMLSFQGNVIYHPDSDKLMYRTGIDIKDGIELLKSVNAAGIYAHTYEEDGLLAIEGGYDLDMYVEATHEPVRFIKSWDEIKADTIPKVICIDYKDPSKLHKHYDEYHASGDEKYECFFSAPMYLEYTKKGTDKGVGTKKLCELLKIDKADSYAIGDEENDIPMLKAVGCGAAVKNGREELKAAADYVCKNDNNNGAFAEFVEDVILK